MSLSLDLQYATMISGRVRNFKRTSNGWNFSCPHCGDSSSNKSKARGYLYRKPDSLFYTCFNCDTPRHDVKSLLEVVDPSLAEQYHIDAFLERKEQKASEPAVKKPKFVDAVDSSLIKVSSLPSFHRAKQYVVDRRIPSDKHYLLYYTPNFKQFARKIDPSVYQEFDPHRHEDEPRLIIPLVAANGKIAGYQGRAFGESQAKYLTILAHEDNPKIFGMERVDRNYRVRTFEGPIDALFIDNAIATCGSRLDTAIDEANVERKRTVVVYDNEPRNKHTIAKIEKAIKNGFPVCIWPSSIKETDVNAMVLSGQAPSKIQQIIDDNTYQGLEATLALTKWKRI